MVDTVAVSELVLDMVGLTVKLPLRDGDPLTLLVTVAVSDLVTVTLPLCVIDMDGDTEAV